jgi:glycosyltransferase involved in cell wall biosynthesis
MDTKKSVEMEELENSGLFDCQWYCSRYKDVNHLGMNPLQHYIRIGARLLRDPGPHFSTRFYLLTHRDVAQARINPLVHYVMHGRQEGRCIAPAGYNLLPQAPEHPVPLLDADPPGERAARMIAFYLPQFHPIPENDEWWGEGFTEWTNVRPAKPQFLRHYQPHVPGDLGYYDLRDTAVQSRQVELAKLYGIEGFCFYFYWFAGKRLLETPLRNYLGDTSLDLPFCLCWANENWSRRWDGRDQDVLMAQEHSPEDDIAFIHHVAQYVRDPRYIRVDGKPLLLVYRPSLLPEPTATAARWRKWCRENGLGEIYLAYTQSFESNDPGEYGFDAAVEFPPNNSGIPLITEHCPVNPDFQGNIFDWSALVERSFAYQSKPYTLFRGICPSWDNVARRGVKGTVLAHSSPDRFSRWANNAIRDAKKRFKDPTERLVFINAWNEWAEGAHLEPDRRYGYAWLEAIRMALSCNVDAQPLSLAEARVAVVVDVQSAGGVEEILEACQALPDRCKLFVVVPRFESTLRSALEGMGREFSIVVSTGEVRDLFPLLRLLPALRNEDFDVVVKLPSDSGNEGLAARRDGQAFDLRSAKGIEHGLALLAADPSLGMICAEGERLRDRISASLLQLGGRFGLSNDETRDHAIWRGNSFIARVSALGPLECLAFSDKAFQPGSLEFEPDLVEAIRRAHALAPAAMGLRVADAATLSTKAGRRRVLIASHDAQPHGAQLLALNMARTFGEMGYEVDMVVLGRGSLLNRFREVASVHMVDMDRPSDVLRLLAALRVTGIEFAIANTTVSGLLVPLLKQAGLPTVSLIHELPGVLSSYGLEVHAQAIAEHADSIVFPARIVKQGFEEFVGRSLEQARIRPQGLYLRNPHRSQAERDSMRTHIRGELGVAEDARIVLCAGYADHRKGLDLFADACIQVLDQDPRAIAVWIGHADDRLLDEVRTSIHQAGHTDRFVFTGRIDNPQDYYAAADVYALTSREDPFPSVVLEALDACVPVVSFAGVVGSEEVLERGTGLLVPAFDTDAMAAAIRKLLDTPKLAVELASLGQRLVRDEFSFRHYLFDLASIAGRPLPKVSVVVPNYNYARYIRERLESIERQTLPPYELIVLDDASPDDSVDVIQAFLAGCDVPAKLVVNESNSGSVFRQWQKGVEMARGEFVWIAEADDLADPEFLETTLAAFADPDVVLSYTQSRQMDGEGRILCENYLDYVSDIDPDRWTKPYVASGREEIARALYLKNTIPNVSGVVFRRNELRRALAEHGDEIVSFRNAGDWVVYLRLLEQGSVAYNPRSLNSHRRHGQSVTIGNFNLRQLREITEVQQRAILRHELGDAAIAQADRYAQKLYMQFELATDEYPDYRDHPALRPQHNATRSVSSRPSPSRQTTYRRDHQ